MDIACEGMASESDPLGSGIPSLVCLKHRKRAVATHSLLDDRNKILFLFFSLLNNFQVLNFCGFGQPQKILNYGLFLTMLSLSFLFVYPVGNINEVRVLAQLGILTR